MAQFTYVFVTFLSMFIYVLLAAMLVRAVTGWFVQEATPLTDFLYIATEPIIMPVRLLCEGLGWFQGVPVDMPFLITTVLLGFAGVLLRTAV